MKWVFAAYTIAWTVHIVYIAILVRGFKKVQEEVKDLER
jgi:CcmD family protein